MKAIAIDDEPHALEIVKKFSFKVPYLKLMDTFSDAFLALEYLQKQHVDLIFLDIEMPDISGINFLNSLNYKPLVIFTTAYPEHAALGFELDAVDYLLKPFSITRFIKSCNKAYKFYSFEHTDEKNEVLFIKTGHSQVRISVDDILFLEATGNYINFVLENDKIISRTTIAEIWGQLPLGKFIRAHRSFIVSLSKIDKLERTQLTIRKYKIPISETYRKEIQAVIRNF